MKVRFQNFSAKAMQHVTDKKIKTLQNCEDEAIHLIESVQSFGYVIAVDPETKFRWLVKTSMSYLKSVSLRVKLLLLSSSIRLPKMHQPFKVSIKALKAGIHAERINGNLPKTHFV